MTTHIHTSGRDSPVVFAPNSESEEWLFQWRAVSARELVDSAVVEVSDDITVEEACETLLSKQISCLAVKSSSAGQFPYIGLFDFSDVNAFLTLAATQHTIHPDVLRSNPSLERIVTAAKAGKVPVQLVSNLSEKNPLEMLSETDTIVELLAVFARGTHRVLIHSAADHNAFIGFVTDRSLLQHFHRHAQAMPTLQRFLQNHIYSLHLPSLNLRSAVVYCKASDTVLEAMKKMDQQGVSSVAVLEDGFTAGNPGGGLLSAVSVTDIGRLVVPSEGKEVLTTPLSQFIAQIKEPHGSTDGADRYPVYSVYAASSLRYTIEKILATTAHRVFVVEDSSAPISPTGASPPAAISGNTMHLRGVVSIIDVLSLFARLANLPDVDPTKMTRKRRESSASTSSQSSQRNNR